MHTLLRPPAAVLRLIAASTSTANLLVGLLADRFRSTGDAQPIAHAVAWAMMPWLLAIACLLRATRHAVVLAPVEPVAK